MSKQKNDTREVIDIDLAESKIEIKQLTKDLEFKGGRGLTSKCISKETDPCVHPLSEDNNFYIAPGLLSGTPCPNSGRCSMGAKSPLTGGIKETNTGGTLATYLARMGIALIKIKGKSKKENVIYIEDISKEEGNNNIKVSLHIVENVKGKQTYEAAKTLQDKFGSNACIVIIGPAGEKGYLASCLCITDIDGKPTRQAGRGGLGAVLGSKGIKAVVVKKPSKTKIDYIDKDNFMKNAKEFTDILKKSEVTSKSLPDYGTNVCMGAMNNSGALPTRNFSSGKFEGVDKIDGEALRNTILNRGANPTHPCMPGCIIKCSNTYNDEKGKELTGGFEYECIWALGANCGIDNLDYIAYMNRLCDELGIDCIEMGVTIAVIMESGYIDFGDKEGAVKLLEEIKKDSPLGRIVASGCVIAGAAFGVKRIPHVRGQGMPAYDPRGAKGIGTTYATSPMGADHTAGYTIADEIFKIGKDVSPLESKGKTALSKEFQQYTAFLDSTGLCLFITLATLGDDRGLKPAVEMLNSKYGINLNEEDICKIGNEMLQLEIEFNEKCGMSKYTNDVPEFMRKEKLDTHDSVYDVDKKELVEF